MNQKFCYFCKKVVMFSRSEQNDSWSNQFHSKFLCRIAFFQLWISKTGITYRHFHIPTAPLFFWSPFSESLIQDKYISIAYDGERKTCNREKKSTHLHWKLQIHFFIVQITYIYIHTHFYFYVLLHAIVNYSLLQRELGGYECIEWYVL